MDFSVIYIDAHTGRTFTSHVYKYRVCTYIRDNTRGGRESEGHRDQDQNQDHDILPLSHSLLYFFCAYFFSVLA